MKINIWGCRGSITVSGQDTVRYGGESTCVEVITDDEQHIIIDAGSGIRKLGKKLVKQKTVTDLTMLFTHAHWDHLAGFPFFIPAYSPDFTIALCGGPDAQDSVLNYLKHEMDPPYFPVDFSMLKAKFITGCRCSKSNCEKNLTGTNPALACESIPLNHPDGGYGYKFSGHHGSFVFLTDNEIRHQHPNGRPREEYVGFCRNASVVFHDAQYLETEYKMTRGWGHSTYQDALDLAIDAGVQRLGLFHHDPDRTDDELDRNVEWCRQYIGDKGSSLECFACAEGMKLSI